MFKMVSTPKLFRITIQKALLYLLVTFGISSCITKEEVGLAQYFLDNQSVYDIHIRASYISSVMNTCDSCYVGKNTKILLGHDSNFGHAPQPSETIIKISVYRNDTLKKEFTQPIADSIWLKQKGENTYDYNYILEINNKDLE